MSGPSRALWAEARAALTLLEAADQVGPYRGAIIPLDVTIKVTELRVELARAGVPKPPELARALGAVLWGGVRVPAEATAMVAAKALELALNDLASLGLNLAELEQLGRLGVIVADLKAHARAESIRHLAKVANQPVRARRRPSSN